MNIRIKSILASRKHSLRWATFGAILSGFGAQASLMVSGVLVARALGADGRGQLALLILFTLLVTKFGECGLSHSLTFFISRTPDDAHNICRKIWAVFPIQIILLAHVHFGILWIYFSSQSESIQWAAMFTLVAVPGNLASRYGFAVIQAKQRFRLLNVLRLLLPLSYSLVILALLLCQTGTLSAILVGWSITTLLSGAITLYLSLPEISKSAARPNSSPSTKTMFQFGLKGLLGSMNSIETIRLDQLFAGLIISPLALGYYVVAQAFTNLPGILAFSSGTIAYPAIASHQNNSGRVTLVWRYWQGITILNLCIVLVLVPLMPVFIPFFFGPEFEPSIFISQILLVGAFFSASRSILVEGIRGLGHPQISSCAEFALYPWLLTIGLYLVTNYGIIGLAFAVTSGYLVSHLVALILYHKTVKMNANCSSPADDLPVATCK